MFRLIGLVFCLTLIGCATQSVPERKTRSQLHTEVGTSYLTNGKLPQALGEFLKAIEYDSENAVAHNNIALVYLFREKLSLAEIHLKKAIRIVPNYTEAQNNLGRVLIERKEYKKAIVQLKKASLDLTFNAPQKVYENLGLAYFKDRNYSQSLTAIGKALEFDKNRCSSLNLKGRTLYSLKNFSLASKSFDLAILHCKGRSFAEPHYFAGLSYLKLGQKELAISRFNEIIELYPNSSFLGRAKRALTRIR